MPNAASPRKLPCSAINARFLGAAMLLLARVNATKNTITATSTPISETFSTRLYSGGL